MSGRVRSVASECSAPWRSAPGVEDSAEDGTEGGAEDGAAVGGPGVEVSHDVGAAAVHVIASRVPRGTQPDGDVPGGLAAPPVRFDEEVLRPESPVRGGRSLACVPEASFTRSLRSVEPVSNVEASSFAARFACDFQSFDEDSPWRRAEVLRDALADPAASTWGWTGVGRQRADSPVPSRLYRRSDTVVFVEVVVRATPYQRVHAPAPEDCPEVAGEWVEPPGTIGRSCAPPEADAAWVAVDPVWVRMTVPVTREASDGRLIVDPGLLSGRVTETGGRS